MSLDIISIIISILAFTLSFHNWYIERMHLKIELKHFNKDNYNRQKPLIIYCIINNRSKNSITINSIDLINNGKKYNSIENSIFLCETSTEILNQEAKWESNSIELPLKLNGFDSCNTGLVFPLDSKIDINSKTKIVFNTSRGKKKIKLSINHKSCKDSK